MKRSAWPRKAVDHQKRARDLESNQPLALVECAPVAIKKIVKSTAVMAKIGDLVDHQYQKTEVVRSETYRRLVAAMPCIACGCGPCQAAHPNTGKGMGMKTDDRLCFPLCGPQPGRPGCHALFDQGAMFTKSQRRAIEPAWGADTRRRIKANGKWPKRLPDFETKEAQALVNIA